MTIVDREEIEIRLLLEAIFQFYGYDFREYAPTSLKRRVAQVLEAEHLNSISGLQEKILDDPECLQRLLMTLSVNVTSMFRDPTFYTSFRTKVIPFLRTYPFIRVWHAGCSTGEEVFSMAILLTEEELYDRCRIYATDFSEPLLERAREGFFPLSTMQENSQNYIKAGGKKEFSEYYAAKYDGVHFDPELTKNIVFAHHNLVSDHSFNEFNVILCRNVMIYFTRQLQNRVHQLLFESLCGLGFLCLGNKENLKFTSCENNYRELDPYEKIYQKLL
jgi:chemotaxis protein methyltransferase CheR